MKTSESIKNIAAALLKAQRLMGGAKKGSSNPYFKSKYADLGSVLEACKELLNDAGVIILQPHITTEQGKFVETTLMHESGEWISSSTEIVCAKANDPQAQGSAITYARRYGLQSLLSMPAEDDDGESAMDRGSVRQGKKVVDGEEESGRRKADHVRAIAQGTRNAPPTKVSPKRGASVEEASEESSGAEEAEIGREEINELIKLRSSVAIQLKRTSGPELVEMLKNEYGVSKKEDLTDEQANEVAEMLKGMIDDENK